MIIIDRTYTTDTHDGEITTHHGWILSLKINPRYWCWYTHVNEAGLRGIQIGPFVLEAWN